MTIFEIEQVLRFNMNAKRYFCPNCCKRHRKLIMISGEKPDEFSTDCWCNPELRNTLSWVAVAIPIRDENLNPISWQEGYNLVKKEFENVRTD